MSNEYKIILINDTNGGDGEKSPIAPTSPEGDAGGVKKKGVGDKSVTVKNVAGYVVFKKMAGYVKQGIQYQIGTVALRTGNHELQARLQAVYDIGSQAVSFVGSIAAGAVAGSSFGPVGAAVGAVAGAVFGILDQAINYAQKVETYNIQRNLENTSIALMNVRAGGNVATTSGRRR